MDKVVKREIRIVSKEELEQREASIIFPKKVLIIDPCNPCKETVWCDECDHFPRKESEKSVDTPTSSVKPIGKEITETDGSQLRYPDSNDSFWHSVDVMDLTPTQRKHFKAIMRKEVRK